MLYISSCVCPNQKIAYEYTNTHLLSLYNYILFFSLTHTVPPLSVWFSCVWTLVAISPHKSKVEDLWHMAAICYILHDLQPVFLVKSVKATLLSDILFDPFTSTEQICLNCKTQAHALMYLGVLHHVYTGSHRWHVLQQQPLFKNTVQSAVKFNARAW